MAESDTDIFNEMRGIATVTIFSGVVILLGTIMSDLRLTSFVVAVIFFLGFAIGRSFSVSLDGKPNKDLVQGSFAEFILSALNIFCLVDMLA